MTAQIKVIKPNGEIAEISLGAAINIVGGAVGGSYWNAYVSGNAEVIK